MKMAIWMSPFMTFFISLTSSAGLGLYFFIGGLFAILQTLMVNAYRPRIRKQIEEEAKKHPVKMPAAPATPSSSSTSTADAINQLKKSSPAKEMAKHNRQRNAGKQQHHKSKNN